MDEEISSKQSGRMLLGSHGSKRRRSLAVTLSLFDRLFRAVMLVQSSPSSTRVGCIFEKSFVDCLVGQLIIRFRHVARSPEAPLVS
jgi:hypothetical protein